MANVELTGAPEAEKTKPDYNRAPVERMLGITTPLRSTL